MTVQLISIGNSANDGTGSDPRSAGVIMNDNTLRLDRRAGRANVRPTLLRDGDSKTSEPFYGFQWANSRFPMNIRAGLAVAGGAIGGSGTAATQNGSINNLLWPARLSAMKADVLARTTAGQIVDMILTIGTNDMSGVTGAGALSSETVIANISKYFREFRASGGRTLWLMSVDPRDTVSDVKLAAYNAAYKLFAASTEGVRYIDTTPYLIDPLDSTGCLGSTGAAQFSSMDSVGLHCSSYGTYLKSFAVEKAFRSFYEPLDIIGMDAADALDDTNAPRGNILSRTTGGLTGLGRTTRIGGTDSTTKNDTSSVTGTPPLGYTMTGTLSGTMNIAFSLVTCPKLKAYIGTGAPGDFTGVAITFSGTPSANGEFSMSRFVLTPAYGTTLIELATLFECDNLSGNFGIIVKPQNYSGPDTNGLTLGGGQGANDQLPTLNGLFNPRLIMEPTTATNTGAGLIMRWRAGVPMSGSLILIGISMKAELPLPAVPA
ncbi:SGNH/GDSL hydrolase family protein [Sphingomonas echinoides]|uniref:SGNH/GDSL hydrolase family protein n=1 Tax=Sphingomonas echinoides TaxID=59803 RepID=UPI002413B2B8|nr:SGNH/GDSL hydrolase family protein [Sphingomonas echinoides]